VGQPKGDADDRQATDHAQKHMSDGQPDPGKNNPEEIAQPGSKDSLLSDRACINEFPPERESRKPRNPKRRNRERNADDPDRQNESREQPRKGRDDPTAKHKPQNVAE
jgi:hypothetical protein